MPDVYLRSIEPPIAIVLSKTYAVATPDPPALLSLPSVGVSSLDSGRLWQRRRPFFLCALTGIIVAAGDLAAPLAAGWFQGGGVGETQGGAQGGERPRRTFWVVPGPPTIPTGQLRARS
jgi:hypothetical protein